MPWKQVGMQLCKNLSLMNLSATTLQEAASVRGLLTANGQTLPHEVKCRTAKRSWENLIPNHTMHRELC